MEIKINIRLMFGVQCATKRRCERDLLETIVSWKFDLTF